MFVSRNSKLLLCATLACITAVQGQSQGGTTKPTLGTVQMPGDSGKMKTIYQLGDKGKELHFTLDSATIATRYKAVGANLLAEKDSRLLVLTFTAHNPLKIDQNVDPNAFKFTVVSPDDKNVEYKGSFYEPTKRTPISQALKPAQKVKLEAVIPIFADGPVTKLIVARGAGKVLRYDLREGMVPSKSVFSTDGVSIGTTAAVELAKPFDFGAYDMEIVEIAESTTAIGSYTPSATQGIYFATVKFSNPMLSPISVGWQYFKPELFDENGEALSWRSELVSMSTGTLFSQELDADSTVRARYMFTAAPGLKLSKFKLTHQRTERFVTVKLGAS